MNLTNEVVTEDHHITNIVPSMAHSRNILTIPSTSHGKSNLYYCGGSGSGSRNQNGGSQNYNFGASLKSFPSRSMDPVAGCFGSCEQKQAEEEVVVVVMENHQTLPTSTACGDSAHQHKHQEDSHHAAMCAMMLLLGPKAQAACRSATSNFAMAFTHLVDENAMSIAATLHHRHLLATPTTTTTPNHTDDERVISTATTTTECVSPPKATLVSPHSTGGGHSNDAQNECSSDTTGSRSLEIHSSDLTSVYPYTTTTSTCGITHHNKSLGGDGQGIGGGGGNTMLMNYDYPFNCSSASDGGAPLHSPREIFVSLHPTTSLDCGVLSLGGAHHRSSKYINC